MKIQLQEYFQSTLPKHTIIDSTIQPLLVTVKQRKINSIHQLRSNLLPHQHKEQLTLSPSLYQTVPVFSKSGDSQPKKQSLSFRERITPPLKPKPGSTIESCFRVSKTSRNNYVANPQRIIFVNPVSKVKKHLVDTIDFHEIEKVMFHKPNKINKYQQFFHTLADKKSQGRAKTVARNTRTVKLMQTEQAIATGQLKQSNYSPEQNAFRITQRRKFWSTTREHSKKVVANTLLEVNCMNKTFCLQ